MSTTGMEDNSTLTDIANPVPNRDWWQRFPPLVQLYASYGEKVKKWRRKNHAVNGEPQGVTQRQAFISKLHAELFEEDESENNMVFTVSFDIIWLSLMIVSIILGALFLIGACAKAIYQSIKRKQICPEEEVEWITLL
ncbi:hypothetical protein PRIPAC_96451 [Pristionchus pacificus]|uniref:Uncharacterized protein n=1 Tax=Pristionchus pacificus TaxID=54126 RepID=A0A2A6BCF2_PRIPA|nr:hypothetical protein PRIPAC_96451 [Pristionchus pacificus]|eukprot:PDM63511.1 hypothetical protein PRIPAC_53868 [Pristionchus pacificus]